MWQAHTKYEARKMRARMECKVKILAHLINWPQGILMRVPRCIPQCSAQSPQTGQNKKKLPSFRSLHANPLQRLIKTSNYGWPVMRFVSCTIGQFIICFLLDCIVKPEKGTKKENKYNQRWSSLINYNWFLFGFFLFSFFYENVYLKRGKRIGQQLAFHRPPFWDFKTADQ